MHDILNYLSVLFLPVFISIILIYAIIKKTPVYDTFIEGAKDGLKTSIDILPYLIGIFIAIEAVQSSGALPFIEDAIKPLFTKLSIPEELITLIILRPISGSGSLAVVENIMRDVGPDSFAGRAASVMAGSCETVFYVLALYFGVTAVKKMRHALIAGLVGYFVGILASIFICKII